MGGGTWGLRVGSKEVNRVRGAPELRGQRSLCRSVHEILLKSGCEILSLGFSEAPEVQLPISEVFGQVGGTRDGSWGK